MNETGYMKAREYVRMCEWCKNNGFKEVDKSRGIYVAGISDYTKRDGRLFVRVFSVTDSHAKFYQVQATLQWSNQLPVGLFDTIKICKTISTTHELESLVSKVEDLNRLSNDFDLYQL